MALAPAPSALYQGYDSVSGRGLSTAVFGTLESSGGESVVDCTVCTSLSELKDALEINQSLSVAYGPVGSIDQKMSLLRTLEVSTNSISIVVHSRHCDGVLTVSDVWLR